MTQVKKNTKISKKFTSNTLQSIVESLAGAVFKLQWKLPFTEWGNYYENTNYSYEAAIAKKELVDSMLAAIGKPLHIVQDLGANTGEFSYIAAKYADVVVSQDVDPVAVERNYCTQRDGKTVNIIPLLQNLFSPSPAIGFGNCERYSFVERGRCDVILALALVHHLAISNNTPLAMVASLFAQLGNYLIIEFVPKSDSQVKRLLETRKDIFPNYTQEDFEVVFREYFSIEKKEMVPGTERTMYLMRKKAI